MIHSWWSGSGPRHRRSRDLLPIAVLTVGEWRAADLRNQIGGSQPVLRLPSQIRLSRSVAGFLHSAAGPDPSMTGVCCTVRHAPHPDLDHERPGLPRSVLKTTAHAEHRDHRFRLTTRYGPAPAHPEPAASSAVRAETGRRRSPRSTVRRCTWDRRASRRRGRESSVPG